MLKHAPYSLDLTLCDFLLFPKLKSFVRGTHFQSFEDIHKKIAELLKELSQNDFRRCFEAWKTCVRQCVTSNGNCFEGDNL
jgi:hypothetical protein